MDVSNADSDMLSFVARCFAVLDLRIISCVTAVSVIIVALWFFDFTPIALISLCGFGE